MEMKEPNKIIDLSNFPLAPTGKIPSADEFVAFKKKIAPIINLDLTNYKNTQMERRITSLMHRNNIDNLTAYLKLLQSSPKHLDEFLNMLTINVSEFFRNREKFEELEKKHLPELIKKSPKLKIWSAGCSIGAEIYSLAMIFENLGILNKCELVASDFDRNIIKKAQSGIYNRFEVGTVPPEYMKYFKPLDANGDKYQVDTKLISKVRFENKDLLNSSFDTGFDLILCRNVVIYFTEEAKDILYQKFFGALKPGGILFIGSTERINNHKQFGYELKSAFFYQRP